MTDTIVPHLNPEITWGSIGVIFSLVFTWGAIYRGFQTRFANHDKEILDLRSDMKDAVANLTTSHKELQNDIRIHITANGDQNIKMMTLIADMKLTLAVNSTNVESIQKLQDQLAARVEAISARQTEYIKASLASKT